MQLQLNLMLTLMLILTWTLKTDASADVSVSWFNHVLAFFNLDKVPLMIFVTFWIMPVWVIAIMSNHIIGNHNFWLGLLLLVPNLFVSLFIAKPLTYPFIKMFAILGKDEETSQELLGRTGKVILSASDSKMGQGEVLINGSNYRLNIKTKNDVVKKGQSILIVNYIKAQQCYIVEPYELIN